MPLFPASFEPRTVKVTSSDGLESSLFALHHRAARPPSSPGLPVLLLIHGYPQNHTLWHKWIELWSQSAGDKPPITDTFDIVTVDLPSYGASRKAISTDGSHYAHSKRAVGNDLIALIDTLYDGTDGKKKDIIVIGHDRGARVAHRMARDHRDRVKGLCVQDIVPTVDCWKAMKHDDGHKCTHRMWHWLFLAVETSQPLDMLSSDPRAHHLALLNSWAAPANRTTWHPDALESWVGQYESRDVILGSLEDYRAGARIDVELDEAEGNPTVDCPVLAQYCESLDAAFDTSVWDRSSSTGDVVRMRVGNKDTVGHFTPVEQPEEAASACADWVRRITA